MSDSIDLATLAKQPFELLAEMERRSRRAHAGQSSADMPEEWVGVGFRIGEEQFIANRDQVREVLMLPESMTRVPGARRWLRETYAIRWSASRPRGRSMEWSSTKEGQSIMRRP